MHWLAVDVRRAPTLIADDPPARIAAALMMLRKARTFDDAAHVVSRVPAHDRLALYSRHAIEAAVASCGDQELIDRFGEAAANLLMGTGAK